MRVGIVLAGAPGDMVSGQREATRLRDILLSDRWTSWLSVSRVELPQSRHQ